MNQEVFAMFSASTQRVLMTLARSPEDAVAFHDRLTILRAGLRIGLEVMEKQLGAPQDKATLESLRTASMATLGCATALELCMSTLQLLHPELGRASMTKTTPEPGKDSNGKNRLRILDLDA